VGVSIKKKDDEMSINVFANLGLFIAASIGFGLGTAFFGAIIAFDNEEYFPFASWIIGIFIYGLTVMFMWRW
jgi:hypothetical protein